MSTDNIAITLYDKGLIKSKFFFKIYLKLNNASSLKASTYLLSKNMTMEDIVKVLESGKSENGDVINLKTKEVLKLEGGSEEAGKIIVNQEGTISYAIHNDSWCAIKTESEREQIIKKYVEGDCNLSS